MVAAKDVAADAGVAYVVGDCVAYQEVVDAPAGVVLAGIKAIAPPAVDALDVGVCRAPGIGKAGVEQLGKLAALLVRKAGVAAVGLGVLKVDVLSLLRSISSCATLKSPQVTTGLPVSRSSAFKKPR